MDEINTNEITKQNSARGVQQKANTEAANDGGMSAASLTRKIQDLENCQILLDSDFPSLGIVTQNGVIIVGAKQYKDSLIVNESIIKIEQISKSKAITYVGLSGDFRQLSKAAIKHQINYKIRTHIEISTLDLVTELSEIIQENVEIEKMRPFAVSLLIAGWLKRGELYHLNNYGQLKSVKTMCIGRNASEVNKYLEVYKFSKLTVNAVVPFAIEAIKMAIGDKFVYSFELDVAVVDRNGFRFLEVKDIIDFLNRATLK